MLKAQSYHKIHGGLNFTSDMLVCNIFLLWVNFRVSIEYKQRVNISSTVLEFWVRGHEASGCVSDPMRRVIVMISGWVMWDGRAVGAARGAGGGGGGRGWGGPWWCAARRTWPPHAQRHAWQPARQAKFTRSVLISHLCPFSFPCVHLLSVFFFSTLMH